jgi:nitroreductase
MDFLELAKKRYSVRKYSNKEVEKEKLLRIFEAVRLAPTACNLQPFRFVVITEPEMKNRIAAAYSGKWILPAPVIIAVCGDHSQSWKRRDGKDYCDVDAAIAVDHLTLAAAELGLGTCWIGAFDSRLCHDELKLPAHMEVIALIPLGYPEKEEIPEKNRKDLEDIIRWEV